MNPAYFSPDVQEFLALLNTYQVQYVIVGGEAVIYHGYARLTGDIDIFYRLRKPNVDHLYDALAEFWRGNIPGVEIPEDLGEQGVIIQFGVPPHRIDLLNEHTGIIFEEAWKNRVVEALTIQGKKAIPIHYIGKEELKKNKSATGRPKDMEDLKYL